MKKNLRNKIIRKLQIGRLEDWKIGKLQISKLGNYRFWIGKLRIGRYQFTICNDQFVVRNLQSAICNLQSVILLFMLVTFISCEQNRHAEDEHSHEVGTEYTCPMHPQIVQDEPGSCPICGMDLVKTTGGNGEETAISDDLEFLLQPSNATIISSIGTVKPVKEDVNVTTSANGIITYDTRSAYSIPVRFGGRIEELFVRYNFQPVNKGQKLLEIYSPELLTVQRELLFLLESDPENTALISSAKQKLRLLGVSDSQIRQLVESRQEQNSFAVYSPYDGYVVESQTNAPQMAVPPSNSASRNGGGMGGMGGGRGAAVNTPTQPVSQELGIREGMYVNAGQTLFKVINTSTLRAEFDLYVTDASRINVGDSMTITWRDQELETEVDFIQPFFSQGENFMKVRVYLDGEENSLKVGQLVKANFKSTVEDALWIPAPAVLDLGTQQVVFVEENGVFKPQEVTVGRISGDMIELVDGLSPNEDIAHNAQFMVGSESFIKINNQTRQ